MINLLPPESLARQLGEYRARRLAVAARLFISLLVFSLIVNGFFYWAVRTRTRSVAVELEQLKNQADVQRFNTLAAELKELDQRLRRLDAQRPPASFTSLWPQVAPADGAGVQITEIIYELAAADQVRLDLRGVAASRQDLVAFTRTLRDQPGVTVESPYSNLLEVRDADFSLTVEIDYAPL